MDGDGIRDVGKEMPGSDREVELSVPGWGVGVEVLPITLLLCTFSSPCVLVSALVLQVR